MTFDEVFTYDHLYQSYRKCLNGVRWKGTVQRYEQFSLSNLVQTLEELRKGTFQTGKFYEFTIMERGKVRHIKSVGIAERVVQRCLCDYCLVPLLTNEFIYDCGACIKDKGHHWALGRMKYQLRKYFKKHKSNKGYILQYDFHHYFDTIPHERLINRVSEVLKDTRLLELYSKLVRDFEGEKGLGLGSQISQISALFYPNIIDHYFKGKKGVEAYGRYMDDGYLISSDKELLRECLVDLKRLVSELDIELNIDKTQITKLNHFNFLKARFLLLDTGKVIMTPSRKQITRNRRKIKKLAKMGLPPKEYEQIFNTLLGNLKHYNAFYTRRNLEMLKEELLTINGRNFVKHSSDTGKRIIQEETGLVFEEAIDEIPCRFHYIEEGSDEEVGGEA